LDEDATARYHVDGGDWADLQGDSFDLELSEGEHVIEVRAKDAAGNEAIKSVVVTVDTAPITIAPPAEAADGEKPKISLPDVGPGATVQVKVDGGEWIDVPSGQTEYEFANLEEGEHSAVIRVTDSAGNSAETEPVSFPVSAQSSGGSNGPDGNGDGGSSEGDGNDPLNYATFLAWVAVLAALLAAMLLIMRRRKLGKKPE